jgi:hypothetical protein
VDRLKTQTDALAAALDHGNGSAEKHAKYMRDKVVPAMEKLRETGDENRSAHSRMRSGRCRRIAKCFS